MRILKNIGIDGKDLRLIETLYRKQRVAVRIEDKLTEWTKIKRSQARLLYVTGLF